MSGTPGMSSDGDSLFESAGQFTQVESDNDLILSDDDLYEDVGEGSDNMSDVTPNLEGGRVSLRPPSTRRAPRPLPSPPNRSDGNDGGTSSSTSNQRDSDRQQRRGANPSKRGRAASRSQRVVKRSRPNNHSAEEASTSEWGGRRVQVQQQTDLEAMIAAGVAAALEARDRQTQLAAMSASTPSNGPALPAGTPGPHNLMQRVPAHLRDRITPSTSASSLTTTVNRHTPSWSTGTRPTPPPATRATTPTAIAKLEQPDGLSTDELKAVQQHAKGLTTLSKASHIQEGDNVPSIVATVLELQREPVYIKRWEQLQVALQDLSKQGKFKKTSLNRLKDHTTEFMESVVQRIRNSPYYSADADKSQNALLAHYNEQYDGEPLAHIVRALFIERGGAAYIPPVFYEVCGSTLRLEEVTLPCGPQSTRTTSPCWTLPQVRW